MASLVGTAPRFRFDDHLALHEDAAIRVPGLVIWRFPSRMLSLDRSQAQPGVLQTASDSRGEGRRWSNL